MKTTLRLAISTLTLLAAACGGTEVSNDYEPTPEATVEVTPTPVVPNEKPNAPLLTLSNLSVKPLDEVLVDLSLTDPDGDAMTTACTVVLTSAVPELEIPASLTKVSESSYLFLAPVTQTQIGTAVVRCTATDSRGAESNLAESAAILIDNYVDVEPGSNNYRDVCRIAKIGCKMEFTSEDLMNVNVPDPQFYVPDQLRGAFIDVPHPDFIGSVDLDIDTNATKWSILDDNTPSIQITLGTDAAGLGYALELIPIPTTMTLSSMRLNWKWRVVALASNGMTKENLLAGSILASGNMGLVEPTQVDMTVQDGLVQFTINGTHHTPAIAATNVAGSQLGFSARATGVAFSNAGVVLKP